MAYDHYLPASYIGRFSEDTTEPLRERTVWVANYRTGHLFPTVAGRICGENKFYGAPPHGPWGPVDGLWRGMEEGLSGALDNLVAGNLGIFEWLRLVEFVTGLLVRGPDFNVRHDSRSDAEAKEKLADFLNPSNTNGIRYFELQRLRPSVLVARWTVLETSGTHKQLTNDLGYAPFMRLATGETGISVPVGPRHILLVTPVQGRTLAVFRGGCWRPEIETGWLSDEQHDGFLTVIGTCGARFLIGPDRSAVGKYALRQDQPPPIPEPSLLGFLSGAMARKYEMLFLGVSKALDMLVPEGAWLSMQFDHDTTVPARGPFLHLPSDEHSTAP